MTERFYIDCEFDGHGGQLLSMAAVREDGPSIYLCIPDQPEALEPWVAEHVWPLVHLRLPIGRTVVYREDFGHFLKSFIWPCQHPVIIADSPVDIGRFCSVISTRDDGGWLPSGYPRLTFEVHNVDCYPTDLPGAVQHNAWWDAMALRHRLRDSGSQPKAENRSEAEG